MKRMFAFLVCLFATLPLSVEVAGSTTPVFLKIEVVEREVVRGEKVEVDLHIFTLSDAIVDIEQLRGLSPDNFIFEDMISSGIVPYDQRYNYQRVRLLFSLKQAPNYGLFEFPKISLAYRTVDEGGKTKHVGKVKSVEKLKMEIVAFRIKVDPDRHAVRIGEKAHYRVLVAHENQVRVFVEKDKIEAGPWKFLGYTIEVLGEERVRKTAIDFVYTYYNMPERMAELPGPLIFVKMPQADRAAEVKMSSSRFLIRSSLSPETRFQSWDKMPGFRSPLKIYDPYVSYGVYGLAILFFVSGAALTISSFGKARSRRIVAVKPECVYRMKRQLEIQLGKEVPSDGLVLQEYGVNLYCLLQRFLGAKRLMLPEEALATPLEKFRDSAPEQDQPLYEPLLKLERAIWSGECRNAQDMREINRGLGNFMRQVRANSKTVLTSFPVDF